MRNLCLYVLAFLEVSILTLGRNIDNSETTVDDIGPPLNIDYYSKLRINKTELNPKGAKGFSLELLENGRIEETNMKTRNGIQDNLKWGGAVIPFTLEASFSEQQKGILARAITRLESVSSIRFKTRTSEADYVHITRSDVGCYSQVGRTGGKQQLNMNDACFRDSTSGYAVALHEFLHAAGFHHQQSAPDRDKYVKISLENVKEGKSHNFLLKIDSKTFNVPYDYCSTMHYSAYAWSKNGKPTIEKLKSSNCDIGLKPELSYRDIRKLNLLYNSNPCGGNNWKYDAVSGKCYQVLNEKKNWYESRLACQALSDKSAYISDLAVIKSKAENDFIHSILRSWHYWSWIGLHDTVSENTFQWITDGSKGFNNFNHGEPNNHNNNEDCVEMYRWWRPGMWNDNNCHFRNYPICQQFSREPCLEGWSYYSPTGSCFITTTKKLHWEEAKLACASLARGSSLAKITTTGENNLAIDLIKKTSASFGVWMGANDISREGSYVWLDGSRVSFSDWNKGEPNNWRGNEDCIHWWVLRGYKWNDVSCNGYNFLAVCQMPASG